MDPSTSSRVPDPHGSAADADGFGFADHAVELLDSEGDLAVLSGPATGTQLGADQVLVAAHGGFGLITQAVLGRAGRCCMDPSSGVLDWRSVGRSFLL